MVEWVDFEEIAGVEEECWKCEENLLQWSIGFEENIEFTKRRSVTGRAGSTCRAKTIKIEFEETEGENAQLDVPGESETHSTTRDEKSSLNL